MLGEMPPESFAEWFAYFVIEPFGSHFQMGMAGAKPDEHIARLKDSLGMNGKAAAHPFAALAKATGAVVLAPAKETTAG
jgi:hypothetical protein